MRESVFLKCICRSRLMMAPTSQMHVSVVGTGAPGTPKSVIICTDSTRYLINCGEGTQRILTEHKSKISKIQHVFFTRMSWRHLSGLLGIALTVKMAGVKKMLVHGPPNVIELMKMTRHFADASTTEVAQSSILQKPMRNDDFVITAFELTEEELIEPRGDVMRSAKIRQLVEGHPLTLDDGRVISPEEVTDEPAIPRNILVLECPHESYIPRFLQADQLFNAIAASQDSNESYRGTVPGITLAIHFVPSGLFESPAYQTFVSRLNQFGQCEKSGGAMMNEINSNGASYIGDTDNGDGLHHLVLDGSETRRPCPAVIGIFSQSIILHTHFDSHLYPKLMALSSSEPKPNFSHVKPFSQVVYAEPMMRYFLRAHTGFDTYVELSRLNIPFSKGSTAAHCNEVTQILGESPRFLLENCVILDENELLQQAFDPLYVSEVEAEEAFKEMRSKLNSTIAKRHEDGVTSSLEKLEWPEFTFLGTASSSPSKYRNISAILVRLSPNECILLDCGEGTLNQLYALYGVERTHHLLRGLRLILITHMHADHHGGVMTIARKVYDLTRDSTGLSVLAPPPFWKWVDSYTDLFQSTTTTGKHVRLFAINRVYEAPPQSGMASASRCTPDLISPPALSPIWQLRTSDDSVTSAWKQLLSQLELKIEPVKVPHTGTSWAFVLSQDKEGLEDARPWKVVYSGDTPRCSHLAEAGRDCDLLIHEATMGDGYEEQAIAAHHSTTSDAITIGRLMRAKFILLTHFSQRFARLPSFDTFQEDIAPAFDFLQVRLGELWKLPYFLPFYKYAFARHWDLLQTRADANQHRRARAEGALEATRSIVSQALGEVGLPRSTQ
ncbi:unnamed protein product [Hydatigera taeniaeformis]|uniref:ribonuclease Z n=1 Tax=Hydatigena taeniaeformis TaxID=6205 RepID=A0A0R3X0M4_HYDTA|nr:unnamed protein product [Hydatigera taeniaeformis]